VDPIFRGSRLFYSWIIAEGAVRRGYKPVIITRTHSRTDNCQELFVDDHPELHEVVNLPGEFWYGSIDCIGLEEVFNKIVNITNNRDVGLIYFSGINEIYSSLFKLLKIGKVPNLDKIPVVFTDYDAMFLLREIACNPPHNILKRLQWGLKKRYRDKRKLENYKYLNSRITNLHIMLLDERINDSSLTRLSDRYKNIFSFLPDPPSPVRMNNTISRARKDNTLIKILIVGKQSRRKGILDVIQAVEEKWTGHENIRFVISGNLEKEMEYIRPKLIELKSRICWHDDYVSNKTLLERFDDADYVMLPYTTDFNGSSGVMAMAAQCGKPLITTGHGLIGYRTKANKIGFTYKSGDIRELKNILCKLPGPGQCDYSKMSDACKKFSRENSIEKHQEIILSRAGQQKIWTKIYR
jgi:glycosyltransferase involved in cell wall biosynthesis